MDKYGGHKSDHRSTETEKKFLEMFSKKIGVDIRFIDSDTANRGEYKPNEGAIYLNLNNGINMFEVALHEGIGEFMAASNEKAYNQIVDSVLNAYAAMNSNKLASDIRAYQKAYKGDMYGDSARGASRELFNDALGEILSSESNLKKMFDWMVANEGEAQANKVKKTLVDYFKDIVDMIKSIKNLGGLSRLERNKMRLSEEQANKYADMIFKAMDEAIASRDAAVENNNISPENYERSSKYVDTDKTKDIHANTELYLSDNDIDAYLAVGSQAHKQKVKNYRNGKQVILRTEKELNEFVEEAIKGNRQDTVAYGRLSDVLSQKIMDAANDRGIFISIENYYVALVGNDLYHSYKNHAEPKQEGDLPMSYDELLYAIKNINTAEVDFITETKNKTQTAYLSFDMGDGVVEMLEVVSTGNGTLNFKNAWKQTYEKHKKYKSTKDVARGRTSKIARASDAFLDSSLTRTKDNSTDNLSKNSEESVNNARKSISVDTNGRELSEGQKEYFADSKVVDEDGKLKVVFHGTEEEFNEFKANDFLSEANGASQIKGYFSEDEEYAERYGNTKAYYLNITNPLIMDGDAKTLDEWTKFFAKNGINNVIFDSSVTGVNGSKDTLKGANSNGKVYYAFYEIFDTENIWHGDGNVTEKIAAAGYDGIQTNDEYEKAWIPFDSKQIKRTDNLNPTNDSDIRYSKELGEIEQEAVEHFGTTDNFRVAGYLLADGTLLDFSGAHWLEGESPEYIAKWKSQNDIRQVDHEDIYEVMEASGDNRKQFMDRGNIRLNPEAPGFNISSKVEPTAAQYLELKEFIREVKKNPYYDASRFYVDIEDTHPNKISYANNLNEDRIINDIKRYYETGELPQQSSLNDFRYSKKIDLEYDNAFKANDTDKMQQLVEQAAREAGYNSPLLYHGTQKFGFTEFDLNKMDDKQTIFLTSNNNIASTYSGTTQNKAISESFGDIDAIPDDKLADALNSVSPDDGMKGEYEYYDQAKIDSLKRETISGIKDLFRLVDTLINTVEDEKGLKALKKIREIEMLTSAEQVMEDQTVKKDLSTALYMLLNHTEVLSKSGEWTTNNDYVLENPEKWSNLEHNIRKAYALLHDRNTADNTFIVESYLDGYAFDVWTPTEARMDLKKNVGKGNYSLYAKLGNSLVIDAKGKNWNSLDNWTRAYTDQFNISNTEAEIYEGRVYLLSNDGEILLNFEASDFHKSMTPEELHSHLINTLPALFETDKVKVADLTTTRDIAKFAKDRGYDSVVIKNVRDNGGRNHKIDYDELADIYLLFNPNDAKSADPVTYDDNGDVIPLSERFNTEDNDLRYSKKVTLPDGTSYVKLDGNLYDDGNGGELSPKEAYKKLINTKVVVSDGDEIYFVNRLPGRKEMYNELFRRTPKYKGVADVKEVNDKINRNIIQLFESSEAMQKNISDVNNRHSKNGIVSFDTREVLMADDTNAYRLELSIANLDDGRKVAYAKKWLEVDNKLLKKIKAATTSQSPQKLPSKNIVPPAQQNASTTSSGEDIRNSIKVDWDTHSNYEVPARTYEDTIFFLGTDEEIEAAEKQDITVKAYIANIIHSKDFKGLMFTDTIGDQRFLTRSTREGYDWQLSQGRDGEPIGHDNFINENDDITSYDTWPKQTLAALYNEILNDLPKEGTKIHVVREGAAENARNSIKIYGEASPYSDSINETKVVQTMLGSMNSALQQADAFTVSNDTYMQIEKSILKKYNSNIAEGELAANISYAFAYMSANKLDTNYESMMNYLLNIGDEVIKKSNLKDPESVKTYDEAKNVLKSYKFKLNEQDRAELKNVFGGNWQSAFGELNRAGIKLDNDKGVDIDTVFTQLQSEFLMTTGINLEKYDKPSEQIIGILDSMKALEPTAYLWDGANDMDKALTVVADIIDAYYSNATGQLVSNVVKGTKKGNEKITQAINKEKAKLNKRFNEYKANKADEFNQVVAEKNRIIQQQQIQLRQQNEQLRKWDKELAAKEKQLILSDKQIKQNARIEAQKAVQSYKEREERAKQMDNIRKSGIRMIKWLTNPTDTQHVPEFLQRPLAEFLAAIDFLPTNAKANSKNTLTWQQRMNDLRQELIRIKDAEAEGMDDVRAYFAQNMVAKDLIQMMDDFLGKETWDEFTQSYIVTKRAAKKVSLLDASDLAKLNKIMSALSTSINNMNKTYANKVFENISKVAKTSVDEMDKLPDKKDMQKLVGKVFNFLNFDELEPITYFEGLGKGAKSIYDELREGFNLKTRHVREADEYMTNAKKELEISDSNLSKWKYQLHEFDLVEGKIKMNTTQIMSLYEILKRKQGKPHVAVGGIKVADYFYKDGAFTRKHHQAKAVHIMSSEAQAIIDTLTDEQKALADKMQQYMASECASWGNRVTEKMFGYKKYEEEDYFPLKTDAHSRATTASSDNNVSYYSIKNSSFTKPITPMANNAVVIGDIFDVFTDHVVQMAEYDAYVMPIADAMRWFNYSERVINAVAPDELNEAGARVDYIGNMQESIDRVYGDAGLNYFRQFIKDINGDYAGKGGKSEILNSFMSMYKAQAVGANLRVAIQQPTAVVRASDVIEPKYLLKALAGNPHAIKYAKKAQANSEIAYWKAQGYYETYLGQSFKEIITGDATLKDKANEVGGWLAGFADDASWGIMYHAAELKVMETQPQLDVNSDAFNKAATRIFEDIIDHTQVVDTIFHKSQWMRSQELGHKITSAFMAEPTKTYNMLYRAYRDAKLSGDKGYAVKRLKNVALIFLFEQMLNAIVTGAWDMLRDDEKENRLTSFKEHFRENAIDNINPLNLIPIGKEFISAIQGYDATSYTTDAIYTAVDSFNAAVKFAKGESTKTAYGNIYQLAKAFSQLTGVPVANTMREFKTLYNNVNDLWNGKDLVNTQSMEKKIEKNKESKRISEIYDTNDLSSMSAEITNTYNSAIEAGKSESDAWSATRTMLKEQYQRQVAEHPEDKAAIGNRYATLVSKTKHSVSGTYKNYTVDQAKKQYVDKWYASLEK